ncbi:aminotransferase class V-fold PLP-dependent enzyme [Streptomyces sp. NBC_00211]|uniref:aminotransferase class V-fold PLP-dependent enzyme n=1 Tax=Streptomyces sp. NBC_00211 TaxID=2975683 RepID=UPI00324A7A31
MNDQPASHQTNDIAAVDAKEQLMSTEPPNREIHTGPGDSRDRGGGASLHPLRSAHDTFIGGSVPEESELRRLACVCGIEVTVRAVQDGPLTINEAQRLFVPNSGYLDTATYGLPSYPTAVAVSEGAVEWLHGEASPLVYHAAITAARACFARIVGVGESEVAIGATTAGFVGAIANSVPRGTTVLVSEDEFSSACWPFLAHAQQGHYEVKIVPLDGLAEAVKAGVSLVVVSAAQSIDGSVADLEAISSAADAHGAWTMVDATQAVGWMPIDARRYTFLICHAYKFLGAPRGAAFMAIRQEAISSILAISANWYAGEVLWDSLYGAPLRLAGDARRHDTSPAWLAWLGAVPALKLIEQVGVNVINRHDVGLANKFREGMNMTPVPSPIVSVRGIPKAKERLAARGLRASVRGDGVRLAFHLYNSSNDVDMALQALRQ